MIIALFIFMPTKELPKKYQAYFSPQKEIHSSQLRATFLGVSSFVIQDDKTTLLVDGFLTRPSKSQLLFTKIETNKPLVTQVLKQLNINHIDAIFALHSHHDHAMDLPYIATKTNAKIYGSQSTLNIAKAYTIPKEKLHKIQKRTTLSIGDFVITVLPSAHTKMGLLGSLVGLGEAITTPLNKKEHVTAYKEGRTYALHIKHPKGTLFINGSTAYKKGMTQGLQANTVFLGVAKFGKKETKFQEAYYQEVVTNLNAKNVIPIHWDDFTKNLHQPIIPLPKLFDDFESSMEFLIQKSMINKTNLILMDFFETIEIDSQK